MRCGPIILTSLTILTSTGHAAEPLKQLTLGEPHEGKIHNVTQVDHYEINLKAGVTYEITVSGQDTKGGTLPDPYMSVRAKSTIPVGSADNSNGRDPWLGLWVTNGGPHLISVQSNSRGIGTYVIKVDILKR